MVLPQTVSGLLQKPNWSLESLFFRFFLWSCSCGDNLCSLSDCLPNYYQYVNCPTRHDACVDLCYGNIPGAYRVKALPGLWHSDHNMIQLTPLYKPRVRTLPVQKLNIKSWTNEATEDLRHRFSCTDWNVFIDTAQRWMWSLIIFASAKTLLFQQSVGNKGTKRTVNPFTSGILYFSGPPYKIIFSKNSEKISSHYKFLCQWYDVRTTK